ncbi:MAG: tetratricopeptide repeat protein [Anaerolineae bacterium]|nr:tetratricopeptide repeat protein [Anaerolineae bacterium]
MNREVEELIRQGMAAARVGEKEEARRHFEAALRLDPNAAAAWLGLSGVVDSPEEKRRCFQRVLELEPGNAEALAGLAWLDRQQAQAPAEAPEVLYCANHPTVETVLRCNRCNKPICVECAVQTPVGYRCKECVAELQAHYFNAQAWDYPVAAAVTLFLSIFVGAFLPWLMSMLPYGWLFVFFLTPPISGGIAEAARRAVGRRRGKYTWLTTSAAGVLGGILGILILWWQIGVMPWLTFLIFIVLHASTLSMRLR